MTLCRYVPTMRRWHDAPMRNWLSCVDCGVLLAGREQCAVDLRSLAMQSADFRRVGFYEPRGAYKNPDTMQRGVRA